jgi:hypothetical protein
MANELKGAGSSPERLTYTRRQRVFRTILYSIGPYIKVNTIAQRVKGVKNEEIKGIKILISFRKH